MNIVLAHGILGFSNVGPVNYFNGVAEHLRQQFQARVFAAQVDKTAGTLLRSGQLKQQIAAALTRGDLNLAQPLHIIAHSMGGLDARRMIAADATIQGVPVNTLATVGTPHWGSPIADLVSGEYVPKLPGLELAMEVAKAGLGDILGHFGVSLAGLDDLRTGAAVVFNRTFPDNPAVKYLSYGGNGRTSLLGLKPTSAFFLGFHDFIRVFQGEASDGVVPVSSAKWTNFDESFWPADHADEIGHNLDDVLQPIRPDIRDRYDAIVSRF